MPTNRTATMPLRVFFGHHKCATGWITTILMEMCFHMGVKFDIAHLPVHFNPYGGLPGFIDAKETDFLAYTNAKKEHIDDLDFHSGFHVVRDPRDVLVSAYFSHLHSHPTEDWPELEPHRKELNQLSKEEGLFCEMDFSREEFDDMFNWDYDQENVLEFKMEDFTATPEESFLQVAEFLDLLDDEDRSGVGETVHRLQMRMNRLNHKGRRFMPGNVPMFPVPKSRLKQLPREEVLRIVREKSFKRLAGGRKKGQENIKSHYRKGVPGDWVNHFTDEHKQRFKDRHGDLLIKLGYESDYNW